MKRLIAFVCLMTAVLCGLQAQVKEDPNKIVKDRMDNMRSKLKLTSTTEQNAFWTAYATSPNACRPPAGCCR